jgi:hypothetical protein
MTRTIFAALLLSLSLPAAGQSLVAQAGADDRLGLQVAFPVNEYLSIQAGYSEMTTEIPVDTPPFIGAKKVTAQALGADAVFLLPVTSNLHALLAAGLHAMDDTKNSGAETRISVGLSYSLSKTWAVRGEVESFTRTRALLSVAAHF